MLPSVTRRQMTSFRTCSKSTLPPPFAVTFVLAPGQSLSPPRLISHVMVMSLSANVRNRVRRKTGKELMVRVHYDEGAAIHIGPESCAGGREAVREALTGECAGQPLSHEKDDIPGADAVRYAEGHTKGRAIASSPTTRRGRRPWHVQTLFVREPGGLVADQGGMPRLVRIGKARSRSR